MNGKDQNGVEAIFHAPQGGGEVPRRKPAATEAVEDLKAHASIRRLCYLAYLCCGMGIFLGVLALACLIEGWAVTGGARQPGVGPAPGRPAALAPPLPETSGSTGGAGTESRPTQSAQAIPDAAPAAGAVPVGAAAAPAAGSAEEAVSAGGQPPEPARAGGAAAGASATSDGGAAADGEPDGLLLALSDFTQFLSRGLPTAEAVQWGDSAGALASAAAAALTLGTLLFGFIQLHDQNLRSNEQLRLAQEESLQTREQIKQTEKLYELHATQLRINALTAQLQTAQARVETLWKGSQLDFARQAHFGMGDKPESEQERIVAQLTPGMLEGSEAHLRVQKLVQDWYEVSQALEKALEETRSAARTGSREGSGSGAVAGLRDR